MVTEEEGVPVAAAVAAHQHQLGGDAALNGVVPNGNQHVDPAYNTGNASDDNTVLHSAKMHMMGNVHFGGGGSGEGGETC